LEALVHMQKTIITVLR